MRHPQSYKNLRDEHGGKGSDLTEQGIEDAKLATQKIKQASFKKVIGTPSIQVISALEVMKKFMKIQKIFDQQPIQRFRFWGSSSN